MQDLPPHRLVDTLERRIGALEIEFHRAYWDSQTSATPENDRRRAELEIELRRIKGDREALKAVEAALEADLHEPVLRRQLELLRLSLTGNQMDDARRAEIVELSSGIESDFAKRRPLVGGHRLSDNEIESILKDSDDEDERRRAWIASKEIGRLVADRVRELARLRNAAAIDVGFADYYSMSLELQELSEEWLFGILDEVDGLTADAFAHWKAELDNKLRARFRTDALMPWHYSDPFFQQLPDDGRVSLDPFFADKDAADLAARTFKAWGFDLSGVLSRSDLFAREGKSQHAFCIDIDRTGKDVRILANVVPGERWVETMLHESGHAVYDAGIDRHLPYLLHRPTHTFVTEAIAILCGRLARDPVWLTELAAAPQREVAGIAEQLHEATAAASLLFARWVLVVTHFERELYRDPEGNLDDLWWELVERFQLLTPPPDRNAPDWAAKIHIAAAPVYYQNYLLGEMLASQLHETCVAECGGLAMVPEAGELIQDRVFHSGALMRWDALIEAATGRPLSAEPFAATLSI